MLVFYYEFTDTARLVFFLYVLKQFLSPSLELISMATSFNIGSLEEIGLLDYDLDQIFLDFRQEHLDHLFEIIVQTLDPVFPKRALPDPQTDHLLHNLRIVRFRLFIKFLQLLENLLSAHKVTIELHYKSCT